MIFPLNIPAELKERRQWLMWRWETVGGEKATKVPYRVDGRRASSTNPATWTDFETAASRFGRGGFDGTGFAVTKDDPFTGIDLDDCVNPDTGKIAPKAAELVRRFDSYTEITPSGEGLRIWIKGVKPAGRCSKPGVEIYDTARYFTVAGRMLAASRETVEERQSELEALIAEEFPKTEEPQREEKRPYNGTPGEKLDLAEFLSASGIAVLGEIPDATAERVFRIVCPWVHEHTGGDRSGTRAGQYADGAVWFICEHAHCAERGWRKLREEVIPPGDKRGGRVYARRRGVVSVG